MTRTPTRRAPKRLAALFDYALLVTRADQPLKTHKELNDAHGPRKSKSGSGFPPRKVVVSRNRVYQIADAKRCRRFEVTHVRGARTASLRASIRPSLGLSLAYSSVPGGDFFVKEHGEQAGLGQVSSRGALWLC